jgi:hypothetical protein
VAVAQIDSPRPHPPDVVVPSSPNPCCDRQASPFA